MNANEVAAVSVTGGKYMGLWLRLDHTGRIEMVEVLGSGIRRSNYRVVTKGYVPADAFYAYESIGSQIRPGPGTVSTAVFGAVLFGPVGLLAGGLAARQEHTCMITWLDGTQSVVVASDARSHSQWMALSVKSANGRVVSAQARTNHDANSHDHGPVVDTGSTLRIRYRDRVDGPYTERQLREALGRVPADVEVEVEGVWVPLESGLALLARLAQRQSL